MEVHAGIRWLDLPPQMPINIVLPDYVHLIAGGWSGSQLPDSLECVFRHSHELLNMCINCPAFTYTLEFLRHATAAGTRL